MCVWREVYLCVCGEHVCVEHVCVERGVWREVYLCVYGEHVCVESMCVWREVYLERGVFEMNTEESIHLQVQTILCGSYALPIVQI